jgi:hypothetical protein
MRELLKPGDWITLLLGGALVSGLGVHFWSGPQGDTLIVRSQGKLMDQVSLRRAHSISVSGPLGVTLIEIQPGRARIARDPSPRQLCVKQGWLSRAGQVALCLPNQVSVEVSGPVRAFDSIAY